MPYDPILSKWLTGMDPTPPEEVYPGNEGIELEPNALEAACDSVTWAYSVHFRPEIIQVIRTYVRVSGLAGIKADYDKINERCNELEERCKLYQYREANLVQAAAVAQGEVASLLEAKL